MNKLLFLFAVLILLSSCYYDKAELLKGVSICDTTTVSYSADIQSIFSTNCQTCHSGSAPAANIPLTNHAEVSALNNARLLGVIRFESGYIPMPKGGNKLDNCSIDKIAAWINNGKLNN